MFPDNENKSILKNMRKANSPTLLDRIDDWTYAHPRLATTVAVLVVGSLLVAAINLGLGRPWF